MAVDHPAYAQESEHLRGTYAVVEREILLAREMLAKQEEEVRYARRTDKNRESREELYANALQSVHALEKAAVAPYFTRVDFRENGGGDISYYIGKAGVTDTETQEVCVVDWRAPVANLYYSGQVGPMYYDAPEGRIEGELNLKRNFGIEDRELSMIFDTDVVSHDAYLQSVLGQMTGDRLRDIVTTIQAEQNNVIRHELDSTLIVQGVAGSGKTTIALHRIAYLLYAYRDTLTADKMLILAPSPMFLTFIAGVLPDLGVEHVRQSTFALYMRDALGNFAPKTDPSDRTQEILNAENAERERMTRIAQCKGSMRMEKLLDGFLAEFEKSIAPEEGLVFGPVRLFTKEQMDRILLVDEKPFPLQRRVKEFLKAVRPKVKAAAVRLTEWQKQECARRADRLRAEVKDKGELQTRLTKLFHSRDAQIEKIRLLADAYTDKVPAMLPDLTPMRLFRAFWESLSTHPEEDVREAARYTCGRMESGLPLESEDIAFFALLTARVAELPRGDMRHIVIDEAQDLSALEFRVLQCFNPGARFTIVGDMMQGMHGWRGLRDWNMLRRELFAGETAMMELLTSYRSTVEIMDYASQAAERWPVAGLRRAKPVLRHGEEPAVRIVATERERMREVWERIDNWKERGYVSGCIICRDRKTLRRLEKELGMRTLDPQSGSYTGGFVLAEASCVKGLEFDTVLLADAEAFADTEPDTRLLYVALTRALHTETVLALGELPAQLQ